MSLRSLLNYLVAAAMCSGEISGLSLIAADAEALTPIDLVGSDAALVGELRQPRAAWNDFLRGELYRRLEPSEFYQTLLKSDGYHRWQVMEQSVAHATGSSLSAMLLDLCSQELVLAVYFSDSNQPEGVLLTRAADAATVQTVLQNWQKLEPKSEPVPLDHQGQAYYRRAQVGPRKATLYYATFGSVFALSDHEARIHQVIELQRWSRSSSRPLKRFQDEPAYQPFRSDDASAQATARLLLLARSWDAVVEHTSPTDDGSAMLKRVWPALEAVSVELRQNQGLQLEARLTLAAEQTDARWQAWTAATPKPDSLLASTPPEAVVVAAGGIHFQAFWQFVSEQASEQDKAGWQKPLRVMRGFFGGRDFLNDIIPALTHDVGLYLVHRPGKQDDLPFDGVLVLRFPLGKEVNQLHLALDQAFTAGLTLLSIQTNETHPEAEPATVHSDVSRESILRWLETSLPMRVAYQITPERLIVSRSVSTLRSHLARAQAESSKSAFAAYRDRWFRDSGQFLCIDVRRLRDEFGLDSLHVPANPDGASPADLPRQLLRLCDVGYCATQFEPSQITVRLGVMVEP